MKKCRHAINHFVYGDFRRRSSNLSAKELGKFYDNFVPAFVDVVPVVAEFSSKKILLGFRREHPRMWWTMGRGIIPGESPMETANRVLKEEFGIGSDFNKLDFLCVNSFVSPLRKHPPKENGRHSLVVVFSLGVKRGEMKYFPPQSGKYSEIKWFSLSEVDNQNFDPVMRAMASCF
ncbi:MAG: NUDIX hydrolase [Candidatus Paceibacterota bacterium]